MNLSPIVDHGYLLGLGDDDHPQYLHLNKAAQTLQQNLAVTAGVTIDGVDISVHAANVSAHHVKTTSFAELVDTIADAQTPNTLLRDGTRALIGNLAVNAGITIDGVDISVHAANASAHHPDDQIDTKGSYIWTETDDPRSFPDGVSCSFVSAAEGWPNFGSVLNVKGLAGGQDGSVLQFYSPYREISGGKYLRYRTGLYNNLGWTGWKTVADTPPNVKARAWRNGLQVIVHATPTIVQLANESYDPGTNYSTATYRFTAPYSGYYDFSVAAIFSKDHPVNNLPSPKVYQIFLYKNNAIRINNAGVHSSWGGAVGCTVADIHYLAATDFVDMRVWHNAGVNIELWGEEHSTYMAIHLESIV